MFSNDDEDATVRIAAAHMMHGSQVTYNVDVCRMGTVGAFCSALMLLVFLDTESNE